MKKWKKYLKRISSYFILSLMIFGFSQCSLIFENWDKKISPEKPPYFKIGDTLVYHSDANVDSFYVEWATLLEPGETIDGRPPISEPPNYEHFAGWLIQIDCSDSCSAFMSSITPKGYSVGVCGKYWSFFELDEYVDQTLQIGSYHIEDLYKNNIALDDYKKGILIKTVYYSKKYGVVEYELTNGEVFDLDEACITMMEERH